MSELAVSPRYNFDVATNVKVLNDESIPSCKQIQAKYLQQLQQIRSSLDFDKCIRSGSWLNMSEIARYTNMTVQLPNLYILDPILGNHDITNKNSVVSSNNTNGFDEPACDDSMKSALTVQYADTTESGQLHASITLQQAQRDIDREAVVILNNSKIKGLL